MFFVFSPKFSQFDINTINIGYTVWFSQLEFVLLSILENSGQILKLKSIPKDDK